MLFPQGGGVAKEWRLEKTERKLFILGRCRVRGEGGASLILYLNLADCGGRRICEKEKVGGFRG